MCIRDSYITDRFLPDKAIDLVDEACAMIKTEMDSMPSEDVYKRQVRFMIATFTDLILRVGIAAVLSATALGSTGIWMAWPVGWRCV